MSNTSLATKFDVSGRHSTKIAPSDFCTDIPNIGTVFSISFSDEIPTDKTIEADIKIFLQNGAEPILAHAEGKFSPQTRSITGARIPNRLYFALPGELEISSKVLREARIEINSVTIIEGNSVFDDFSVTH